MFVYLVLLFTILPAIELALLIEIGSNIGIGNTLFIIISTGVLGAYLARLQGFLVFQKIQNDLNRGIMPNDQLIDGLMILVGGIVLLTPGFITDTIGFLLLIPWARAIIKKWSRKKFEEMIAREQTVTFTPLNRSNDHYDDIDI
ncbi:MAG: membrane protein FxsA [Candidatus Omnitrophica bacterium]|nr:membrane protein FxsA [Candidatus Omnitrophota bacterium]MCK5260068.1 membrane protein FxsA [Candidatus Omnitrophota bacterium]